MAAPSKHKLDIFEVLGNLSKKNVAFYQALTEDEKKALQPLVVMRWMTGTSNASQVYFLNELVNPYVFSLTNHKELLVDLMAVCGSGKMHRFQWLKAGGKRTTVQPLAVEVVKEFFNYSTIEAKEALLILKEDVVINYAEQLGWQPDEIKKLKKELSEKNK